MTIKDDEGTPTAPKASITVGPEEELATLAQALERGVPDGAAILFSPGRHDVAGLEVGGVTLKGSGAGASRLVGQLTLAGSVAAQDLGFEGTVDIKKGASVSLRSCSLCGGSGTAIAVLRQATVELSDCDVETAGARTVAAVLSGDARLTATETAFIGSPGQAVKAVGGAVATFVDCRMESTGEFPCLVAGGLAAVRLQRCRVDASLPEGPTVGLTGGAQLEAADTSFSSTLGRVAMFEESSSGNLANCQLKAAGGEGALVATEGARVRLRDCGLVAASKDTATVESTGNARVDAVGTSVVNEVGWASGVAASGRVSFVACRLESERGGAGIGVLGEGRAELADCAVVAASHKMPAALVEDHAGLAGTGTSFTNPLGFAVKVDRSGFASFTGCHLESEGFTVLFLGGRAGAAFDGSRVESRAAVPTAVVVAGAAHLEAAETSFVSEFSDSISLRQGGSASLVECRLVAEGENGAALGADGTGAVRLRGCELRSASPARVGAFLDGEVTLDATATSFTNALGYPVQMRGATRGTFTDCRLETAGPESSAVVTGDSALVTFSACVLASSSKEWATAVSLGESRLVARDSSLTNTLGCAADARRASLGKYEGCDIKAGGDGPGAVAVGDDARLVLSQCIVSHPSDDPDAIFGVFARGRLRLKSGCVVNGQQVADVDSH